MKLIELQRVLYRGTSTIPDALYVNADDISSFYEDERSYITVTVVSLKNGQTYDVFDSCEEIVKQIK